VTRRGFKLLAQFTERDEDYDLGVLDGALRDAGVEHFTVESRAALSKYVEAGMRPSLYVIDESTQKLTEVERYTPLYRRYGGAVRLRRVFVLPEQLTEARAVLARHTRE